MSEIKKPDIYKMNLPADLKKLSTAQCEELCGDIRKILIDTVSKNGGHLASNLGTVELTMAIHRVLNHLKIKSSGTLVIRHIHIKYLRVDSKSLKLSDRKTVFRAFADLTSQCMMLLLVVTAPHLFLRHLGSPRQ